MTIAHDAATLSGNFTNTPDPFTFSHTPAGTPRGVVVLIGTEKITANDLITGITYGGVAMTRLTNGFAVDTLGELICSFGYFLGASIPTGTQTVSIDHTGTTQTKWAVCCTMTAASDTEVAVDAKDQESQANPSAALDSGADVAQRYAVLTYGGLTAGVTNLASMTNLGTVDYVSNSARVDRQTTAGSGSFTIGWTAVSDDVAAVYVAVKESAAAAASLIYDSGMNVALLVQ